MKFFKNIETIEELKKEYKILAKELHPDMNKNVDTTAQFQEMQNEYEELFNQVKNIHKNSSGEKYTKETNETIEEYKNIIDRIIHFENVVIEVIGSWIWLTGDTKKYKEIIKELNFKWSPNKLAWYYHKDKFRKKSNNNYSIDELRNMFENEKIQNEGLKKLA